MLNPNNNIGYYLVEGFDKLDLGIIIKVINTDGWLRDQKCVPYDKYNGFIACLKFLGYEDYDKYVYSGTIKCVFSDDRFHEGEIYTVTHGQVFSSEGRLLFSGMESVDFINTRRDAKFEEVCKSCTI